MEPSSIPPGPDPAPDPRLALPPSDTASGVLSTTTESRPGGTGPWVALLVGASLLLLLCVALTLAAASRGPG